MSKPKSGAKKSKGGKSAKKAPASGGQQAELEAALDAGEPVGEIRIGEIDPNTLHHHEVDESQLLLLIRDWREGRTNRNLRQALQDGYVAVFSVVVIAAMLISTIMRAQSIAGACDTASCVAARNLLPWAALAGTLALTLATARMFGPVVASAAEGFWLMEAPLNRGRLLARRLWMIILAAGLVGFAIGALVAALTGADGWQVVAWTLATGLGAAGLTALSAAEQGADRAVLVSVLQFLASLVALAALIAVVASAAGWITLNPGQLAIELPLGVAVLGAILMLTAGVVARRRLVKIRRTRLVSGGSLVSGMQGAMFAMDFGLMRDMVVEREAVARGRVRPTLGRGTGLSALVWRDVQRLYRFPKPLLLFVVSLVVPYAVQALGLRALVVPISALVLMAALIPFFSALRVLSRTKGLSRALPFTTRQIRQAVTIVPAVMALVWTVITIPAYLGVAGGEAVGGVFESVMYAMVAGLAGLIAAIRWVSAKPADYNAPMVATSAGAMPPGLMFNLVRGFDMVAIITLPVVLGGSPWISVVIAVIAFSILSMGGMSQEDLQAMREENQRQAEAMKSERKDGGKITVTRSKR